MPEPDLQCAVVSCSPLIIPPMGGTYQLPPEHILRLHCVKVFVRDHELSVRFYVDQLGFRLVADTTLHSGERWVAVAPPHGQSVLALVAPSPDSKQAQLIGRPTDIIFITDDVIARYREWSQRGVKFISVPKLRRVKSASGDPLVTGIEAPVWGGVFASFKDLDGNIFSLVSFDEVTHAMEASRRAEADRAEAERRLAQELEIAKQVQAHLFPPDLPIVKTLDYAGRCQQARHVGGDYYDFLPLGRDRLGLAIADIAGKGIAAALLMANLQANLRSQCAFASEEPQRLLQSINRLFCENTPENAYATFFFAQYDDHTGRLQYANCGHLCALLVRSNGEVERLNPTATVLGLFDNWECGLGETRLFDGDLLALYTDGVTEAFDGAGEEYGEQRLLESLLRYRTLPSCSIVDSVIADVRRFSPHEQQDDITLVVAKCRSSANDNQLGFHYDAGA